MADKRTLFLIEYEKFFPFKPLSKKDIKKLMDIKKVPGVFKKTKEKNFDKILDLISENFKEIYDEIFELKHDIAYLGKELKIPKETNEKIQFGMCFRYFYYFDIDNTEWIREFNDLYSEKIKCKNADEWLKNYNSIGGVEGLFYEVVLPWLKKASLKQKLENVFQKNLIDYVCRAKKYDTKFIKGLDESKKKSIDDVTDIRRELGGIYVYHAEALEIINKAKNDKSSPNIEFLRGFFKLNEADRRSFINAFNMTEELNEYSEKAKEYAEKAKGYKRKFLERKRDYEENCKNYKEYSKKSGENYKLYDRYYKKNHFKKDYSEEKANELYNEYSENYSMYEQYFKKANDCFLEAKKYKGESEKYDSLYRECFQKAKKSSSKKNNDLLTIKMISAWEKAGKPNSLASAISYL